MASAERDAAAGWDTPASGPLDDLQRLAGAMLGCSRAVYEPELVDLKAVLRLVDQFGLPPLAGVSPALARMLVEREEGCTRLARSTRFDLPTIKAIWDLATVRGLGPQIERALVNASGLALPRYDALRVLHWFLEGVDLHSSDDFAQALRRRLDSERIPLRPPAVWPGQAEALARLDARERKKREAKRVQRARSARRQKRRAQRDARRSGR